MRERLQQLVAEMIDKGIRYEDARREFEKQFISQTLTSVEGNLGHAAKSLGVHRNTLTRRLRDLKLKVPRS
jgi:DNA-binding NtrC family response regulator